MPDIELLQSGEGEHRLEDPDALRTWMRDRKRRELADRAPAAAELRILGDSGRRIVGRTTKAR